MKISHQDLLLYHDILHILNNSYGIPGPSTGSIITYLTGCGSVTTLVYPK